MKKHLLVFGVIAFAAACGGNSSASTNIGLDTELAADEVQPIEVVDEAYSSFDYNSDPAGSALDVVLRAEEVSEGFPPALIDPNDVLSGGVGVDGIPPIDEPKFVGVDEVDYLTSPTEPLVLVEVNGDAVGFPLRVMISHEIVNTEIGGVPVTVTFCPLCNSALAFDRRVGSRLLDFGVSGTLLNSALLMYDRQTESLWSHFTGEGVLGHYAGLDLNKIPAQTVSFEEFSRAFPDGRILSQFHEENAQEGRYGRNPYVGYDTNNIGFLFDGQTDPRLPAQERVVGIAAEGQALAVPFSLLEDVGVVLIEDEFAVLHRSGLNSALDSSEISEGRDIGQTGVFRLPEGIESLTPDGDNFRDSQGRTWSIIGQLVDGESDIDRLEPVTHLDAFWFAWAAYRPDTSVVS